MSELRENGVRLFLPLKKIIHFFSSPLCNILHVILMIDLKCQDLMKLLNHIYLK